MPVPAHSECMKYQSASLVLHHCCYAFCRDFGVERQDLQDQISNMQAAVAASEAAAEAYKASSGIYMELTCLH